MGASSLLRICQWETMFGMDLDEIFSYSTIKYVRILDRRLGLLKVFFTVAIGLYVLVYQIWFQGGYLQPVSVNGYSRFTLQQPTIDDCDPRKIGCFNDFTDRSKLPYCLESDLPYPGTKQHCRYMDSLGVQTLMTDTIVVGTRGVERTQTLLCDGEDQGTCPLIYSQPTENDNRFFVADIDRYTLLIDHGVLTALPGLSGESRDMQGRISIPRGASAEAASLCRNNPHAYKTLRGNSRASGAPCYVTPNKTVDGFDLIDLGVLMQAAGTSLDELNTNNKNGNRTYRETGGTVMIEITYSNFAGWFLRDPAYSYRVSLVHGSEYKSYESFFEPYPTTRTVLSLAGLHIATLHLGSLYGKSFNYFLIQLTTSLTLLAIANTIIDLLALFCMPDRADYCRAKFETTEDFSDLRKAKTESHLKLSESDSEEGRAGSTSSGSSSGGSSSGAKGSGGGNSGKGTEAKAQ